MLIERRKFLAGLGAMFAAPAIVRAASLMPVRGLVMDAYGRSPAMLSLHDMRLLAFRVGDILEIDGFTKRAVR